MDGPFFEESLPFHEIGGDAELTLYHSALWLKTICTEPGSPFHIMTVAEHHAQLDEHEQMSDELQMLRDKVAELEAEIEKLRYGPPVDVEGLADALVVPLTAHFARKTGPRAKGAA